VAGGSYRRSGRRRGLSRGGNDGSFAAWYGVGGSQSLGMEVRAGCHTGEIEPLGADVGGIAVHIGARIAALAQPSGGPCQLDRQRLGRRAGAAVRRVGRA
jgi:hypothetical protein